MAAREPRLELVELLWTLRAPSGRELTCGVYRTDAGLELRASFEGDDLRKSETVGDVGAGRELAAQWCQAWLSKGRFEFTSSGYLRRRRPIRRNA